mmetsp:Transcript_40089/g.84172  ORF Transcript_40089/g.84172 Transcript_40089/m.84172 type:complete len:293 (+) Transcript_40089:35-913(+)
MVFISSGFVLTSAFLFVTTNNHRHNHNCQRKHKPVHKLRSSTGQIIITRYQQRHCGVSSQLLAAARTGTGNDEGKEEEEPSETDTTDLKTTINDDKPKSRLAMLAEDWMAEEEEEEDDLAKYWQQFEDNKINNQRPQAEPETIEMETNNNNLLTTEERLEQYFDRRGINKRKEKEHSAEIQQAITTAKSILASGRPPQRAIQTLQEVRPYLQSNTRLGGTALFQLVLALYSNDDQEEALLLCRELRQNRHVRGQVVKFMEEGPSSSLLECENAKSSSFWKGTIFDRDLSSWW